MNNLYSRVKKLENRVKPDEVPPVIWGMYKTLGLVRNNIELSKEERIKIAVKEMSERFNLSFDKARDYIDKINPFFIGNCDDSKII